MYRFTCSLVGYDMTPEKLVDGYWCFTVNIQPLSSWRSVLNKGAVCCSKTLVPTSPTRQGIITQKTNKSSPTHVQRYSETFCNTLMSELYWFLYGLQRCSISRRPSTSPILELYECVPWEMEVFNTKIFFAAVPIQNLPTCKLRGYLLKRVVFTMATMSLILS